jgi:pimeloyl-ACP methyl ester carboxylesterase
VRERTEELDEIPIHWWEGEGPPILYLHGVPNAGVLWRDFLARSGGVAVDLPGFGQSAKRADWEYSLEGYGRFVERFVDHLGWDRCRLVMHDWGAVGLVFAQAQPERVERLALLNVVPFLAGFHWHGVARVWRTTAVGELLMGSVSRRTLRLTRRFTGLPAVLDEQVIAHFDQGTQRAILKLYRSAPEDLLAAAGRRLGAVTAPGLVMWGDLDPYIPSRFGDGYAAALGDASVEHLPDAGHWAWIDRPDVVARVSDWIAA